MPYSKKIDILLSIQIQSPVANKRHFKRIILTVYIVNWNHVFTYYKMWEKNNKKENTFYEEKLNPGQKNCMKTNRDKECLSVGPSTTNLWQQGQ